MRSHPRPPVACSAEHVHSARRSEGGRKGGSSWALTHPLDRSLLDHFSVAYCHRGGYEDLARSPQKNLSSDEGRAHDSRRLGGPKAVWIHNQMRAAPSSAFPQNNRTVFAQDSGVAKRCISLPIVPEMMIIHDESRFPPLLSRLVSRKTALHPSLSPQLAPVALAQGFSPPDHD